MKKFCKEYLPYIIIIIVVLLVRTFIVTPVKVSGKSMVDTLNDGDLLFLYKLDDIKKNDIVVVSKEVTGSRIVKRVVGMPGDRIKCEEGIIYINDKKYDDKYAYTITVDFDEIELKDDEYFVMGDNRYISLDSRIFGPVKGKDILGTAELRFWPLKDFGKVE